jgi:hypothetical protein
MEHNSTGWRGQFWPVTDRRPSWSRRLLDWLVGPDRVAAFELIDELDVGTRGRVVPGETEVPSGPGRDPRWKITHHELDVPGWKAFVTLSAQPPDYHDSAWKAQIYRLANGDALTPAEVGPFDTAEDAQDTVEEYLAYMAAVAILNEVPT